MKSRIIDLLVAGFTFLFLLWGLQSSRISTPNQAIQLVQPFVRWEFRAASGFVLDRVEPGWHVCSLLPKQERCEGSYYGYFDLNNQNFRKILSEVNQLAIYLPGIPGAQSVLINGSQIQIPSYSYSSLAGLAISIESFKNLDSSEVIVEIPIKSEQKTLAGMIIEAPLIGEFMALSSYRDERVWYIRNLPLTLSYVYFVVVLIFLWLKDRARIENRLYEDFMVYFLTFSIFNLFLSGELRDQSPYWGSILQFPFSILASCGCFRLIATLGKMNPKVTSQLTLIYFVAFFVSLGLNMAGYEGPQFVFYFMSRLLVLIPVLVLCRSLKNYLDCVIFACCFVFSLLYISDSIKIVSRTLFVFEYPIGFAGRHISPLLLLVSFLFLICEIARENRTLVQKKALEDVAQQVVHDLRSPLAALAAAEPELLQLPEEARLLLRSAISRIRDISYHLIRTYQNPDLLVREATHPRTSHSASVELLSTLLDGLVSEKRIQYRSKIGVSIDWRMTNEAYGLFAQVQTGAFKRILSNLIDNSVEALSDSGKVILDLKSNGNTIEITCQDNGKGIPREVISQLGKKGLSYEKKGGSGLGLYNAKSILQNWGGRLQIESELNVGTQVTLFLPRSPCPEWFVPEVNLFSYSTILVLDDDESIHHIWDGIFDKNRYLNPSAEIFHFCHGQHLRDWVAVDPERASRALFLVDYELIHSQETGLDMIVELNAHSRSILVTSKYENKDVRNGCQDLGVKIIPKCVAPFVPVC